MNLYIVGIKRRLVCHATACLFSVCVVAPLAFMLADRTPQFSLEGGSAIPLVIERGGKYQFRWVLTPKRSGACRGTVHWIITDAQGTLWTTPPQPSLFVELTGPPRIVVGRERILPSGIPPGTMKHESRVEFVCNPIHWIWPIEVKFPPVYSTAK